MSSCRGHAEVSRVAQQKRAGPIIQRSVDGNRPLLSSSVLLLFHSLCLPLAPSAGAFPALLCSCSLGIYGSASLLSAIFLCLLGAKTLKVTLSKADGSVGNTIWKAAQQISQQGHVCPELFLLIRQLNSNFSATSGNLQEPSERRTRLVLLWETPV